MLAAASSAVGKFVADILTEGDIELIKHNCDHDHTFTVNIIYPNTATYDIKTCI